AFVLLAKNPDALWDPLGNILLRSIADTDPRRAPIDWPWVTLAWHWAVGLVTALAGLAGGMRGGAWLGSERGQKWIARGMVAVVALVGATVAIASYAGVLSDVSAGFAQYGHLAMLAILGVGIGAAQVDAYRPLGRVVILFVASSLFYQAWAIGM